MLEQSDALAARKVHFAFRFLRQRGIPQWWSNDGLADCVKAVIRVGPPLSQFCLLFSSYVFCVDSQHFIGNFDDLF